MSHQNPNHAMTEDEQEAFEERAGIAEFDGGMSREEAEALALEAIIRRRETRSTHPRKEQPS